MSRIGKQPVPIPDKVKVDIQGHTVRVEGPKGKVAKTFAPVVSITQADKKITVAPTDDTSRFAKAMYGTARSVIAGMVRGVSEGYTKELEIQGVGFKANLKGSQLDYVEEMVGASFQVNNPNATSSCGCGNSFSV